MHLIQDDWTTEGLEPYHDYCMSCGCPSLTSSPWVPYFMCCVLPCQVRFGSLRSQVGVASRLVGCVRRFRPPPPPLVGFWPVVRPLFCSLAFSGFARSGPGVSCWCFPFFSFFSSSLSFHAHFHFTYPAAAGCVCVPSE